MKGFAQAVVSTPILALAAGCAAMSANAQDDADPNFGPAPVQEGSLDPHAAGRHGQHHPLPDLPATVDLEGTFLAPDGTENGEVRIAQTPNGLLLRIDVGGVAHGFHGVHLHETGLCEPEEDFKTAGGHANPTGAEHGFLPEGGSHLGDLPNAYAHEEGHIRTDLFKEGARLADLQDADGFAVMVHSGADDYRSQPSGDAGSRVACAAFPGQ